MPETTDFEIIGHRGNGCGPDENTLASCIAAVAAGASRVEIDVRLSGGRLVTGHDPGQQAESLQAILDNLDVPLILHIKESQARRFQRRYYRQVVDKVVPLIGGREVVLSSFSPGLMRYCRRQHPEVKTAFATLWPSYDLLLSHNLGISEIHTFPWFLSSAAVKRAARKKLPLVVYTPKNTPLVKRRLRKLGVDQIMTDDVGFWRSET